MMEKSHEPIAIAPIGEDDNRYLSGNFKPIGFETTAYALPVKGVIPKELIGRIVRIGPNPTNATDLQHYHWFTGVGMLHGVRLIDCGAEWYRSRLCSCWN